MRIANDNIIQSDVDLASAFSSNAIYLGHAKFFALQLVFTGTPQGSFTLEASNDKGNVEKITESGRGEKVENWTCIAGSEQVVSEAGNIMYCFELSPFRWVRIVWTPTGGGGTLTSARVNTKGW